MAITKLSNSGIATGGVLKYDSMLAGNTAFAPGNFDSIASVTVSSGVASVEFTAIPATYQHLQIRALTRETNATFPGFSYLQVNNDTGSNYAVHLLSANGSSASVGQATSQSIMYTGPVGSTTANTFGSMIIDILDYRNTSKYKNFRYWTCATNNSSGEMRYGSGLWYSLNGVTSIKLFGNNGNWQQYSSFALYGIKGA